MDIKYLLERWKVASHDAADITRARGGTRFLLLGIEETNPIIRANTE